MSSISSVSSLTTGITSTDTASTSQSLSQSDFLELLMTQLTNQNPLDTADTGAMLQNMCNLSNLQATNQILTNSQVTLGQSLLGKTVSVTDSDGNLVSGVVEEVTVQSDTPYIVIDGTAYDLSSLNSVISSAATTTTE
ncbi:MAG: flagellar hook capping FlgD N-terminal domain-containing protein [Verrucomicrobiae bacterium]|nr:flagellar hook capping FlgD N-terminal domain-containing protein [Verrucomicrobiae bacterium]